MISACPSYPPTGRAGGWQKKGVNMPNKKRYMLIVNPAAGSGKTMKALPQSENILRAKKIEYEFHFFSL